jgi:hypothetical protein
LPPEQEVASSNLAGRTSFSKLAPSNSERSTENRALGVQNSIRSGHQLATKAPVQPFLIVDRVWIEIKDGDASARAIFRRHYSYKPYRDGRDPALFVGPGEKMVLLTPCALALFIWRKFISGDGQKGVNCAVFRNEGAGRASDLIREAMRLAWSRWPAERLFTYVNPKKIRRTRTPGRCFLKAGWRYVRDKQGKRVLTKWRRLPILEALPEWFTTEARG